MLRRYTVETLLEKVDMVRSAIPGIALSTDIIVGFPGETDEEFQATLELMRTVRFHDAYTYKYSLRDGTPATRLPEGDFLPPEVAQERLSTLIDVSRAIQAEINATEVGRVVEILVEKEGRSEGHMMGRSRRNKVVVFPAGRGRVGEYVDVTLERTTGATFVGSAVDSAVVAGTA
jgi:tRNA-2-methylthio-N6-dimethylallyladenosine synthase